MATAASKTQHCCTCPPPLIHPGALAALAAFDEKRMNPTFTPHQLMQSQPTEPKGNKPTSLMQPQLLGEAHPFTLTLKKWWHGIEVDCGPDWIL